MYLLGYIAAQSRIFLADKDVNVYSYSLSLSVIDYQTAILRGDLETAQTLLEAVPQDQRNRVARFLETQELRELALEVSTDPDHKFDLAIQLDDLETALDLVRAAPEVGSEPKWKTVGDKALAAWKVDLAEECFRRAGDLGALLLIYTSIGNQKGTEWLAQAAREWSLIHLGRSSHTLTDLSLACPSSPPVAKGLHNIAFAAFLQLGDVSPCIDLLLKTDRIPEAAFLARTYAPSRAEEVVAKWKSSLEAEGKTKIAKALADPGKESGLFEEGWEDALARERGEEPAPAAAESAEEEREEVETPAAAEEEGEDEEPTEEAAAAPSTVDKIADGVKSLVVGDEDASPAAAAEEDEDEDETLSK